MPHPSWLLYNPAFCHCTWHIIKYRINWGFGGSPRWMGGELVYRTNNMGRLTPPWNPDYVVRMTCVPSSLKLNQVWEWYWDIWDACQLLDLYLHQHFSDAFKRLENCAWFSISANVFHSNKSDDLNSAGGAGVTLWDRLTMTPLQQYLFPQIRRFNTPCKKTYCTSLCDLTMKSV